MCVYMSVFCYHITTPKQHRKYSIKFMSFYFALAYLEICEISAIVFQQQQHGAKLRFYFSGKCWNNMSVEKGIKCLLHTFFLIAFDIIYISFKYSSIKYSQQQFESLWCNPYTYNLHLVSLYLIPDLQKKNS